MESVQNANLQRVSMQLDMAPVSEKPIDTQRFRKAANKPLHATSGLSVGLWRQFGILVLIAALSLGSYYGISRYFLQSVEVVGISMVPTLQERGHYLLNKWTFRCREPRRNDIVVIRDPGDHGFSVKRIIAVEGDSIHFKNGQVFLNGRKLAEPYLLPGVHTFTYAKAREEFITCGKSQYFVLGDNRPVSIDSRSYGPVNSSDILGLVMLN